MSEYERDNPRAKSEYTTVVSEKNGRVSWKVLRKRPHSGWEQAAKGEAASKAEAKYLAEHRREIVREGDAIH